VTDLSPGTLIAGYQIDSLIGRGGMGVVYKANHLALDRAVAIKVIKPELASDEGFRRRFERESRLAASLHHPHIVTIHDAREEEGFLMIVMHHVEGTDLRRVMKRVGRVEPARAVAICSQIGSALDAAHRHELVHRDVKPGNILLSDEYGKETAYLSDFGLGKLISSETGLTGAGMLVGTLDYLAPELIQGQRIDGRCDVYSLGCVLYEALSGRVPYPTEHDVGKIWAHIENPAPSLLQSAADLPAPLDDILQRAMAKDPSNRYPTAGEFCGEAAEVVATPVAGGWRPDPTVPRRAPSPEAGEAGVYPPPPPVAPTSAVSRPADPGPRRRIGRTPLLAGLGVVAALVIAVVAFVALGSGSDGTSESTSAAAQSQTATSTTHHTDMESSADASGEEASGTAEGLPLEGRVPQAVATHAGRVLRSTMRDRELTLASLSEDVHLSNGQHPEAHSLEHIQDGQPATLPMYFRIADALGIPPSRMLGQDVPSRPTASAAMHAGHLVRGFREGRGLSHAEFAQSLYRPDGHSYTARLIAGIERGRRAPLVAYLTISSVTGIKKSELLDTRVL